MDFLKYTAIVFLLILAVIVVLTTIWLSLAYKSAITPPENFLQTSDKDFEVVLHRDSMDEYLSCDKSMLRKNSYGLWELYAEGDAKERGTAMGKLYENLLYYQEQAFVNEIKKIIPSKKYLSFLRIPVFILNRNATNHITNEYLEEIYGISLSCSNDFNWIAPPYLRQVNYHAAHDLGHLLQKYHFVGCTAFGLWDNNSVDGKMIVGRNFDFYVGEAFARNKVVAFYAPDSGYRFASITWAGMIGVLSGMNEKGLCVTLNAADGNIKIKTATPVSIVAREILQYASNIEEAVAIAQKRKTFVSENFVISSAIDHKTIVMEKSPNSTTVYDDKLSRILVTNHFHNDKEVLSDSKYRYKILQQLLDKKDSFDIADVVSVLRNRYGLNGKDIGVCNEYAINQSICHHSIIFKPEELLMWVSTSPYQSGKYICYDLKKIFDKPDFSRDIDITEWAINADEEFMLVDYPNVLNYREISHSIQDAIRKKEKVAEDVLDKFISSNPNYYGTYQLLGDYYKSQKAPQKASMYHSLAKERLPR
ncbi:MAG: C45 family autoproteolytic acyltransferase/hydrolase [Bacteroidales bacterium]|jgi:predicted choloylglycine hydrolase|nr:C45 family autoproteolytic acyltransferase/hydrolase [Bacteroidales bacterium]